MITVPGDWTGVHQVRSQHYSCGYCAHEVGSAIGITDKNGLMGADAYGHIFTRIAYVCPACSNITQFTEGSEQSPGVTFGASVDHLPQQVAGLYQEACACMSVSAYTCATLACRKLLMNVAVNHGAPEGNTFQQYVQHLVAQNVIPSYSVAWVDHIRDKANEATHEFDLITQDEAKQLLAFTEMLLKIVFEFPSKLGTAAPPTAVPPPTSTP